MSSHVQAEERSLRRRASPSRDAQVLEKLLGVLPEPTKRGLKMKKTLHNSNCPNMMHNSLSDDKGW